MAWASAPVEVAVLCEEIGRRLVAAPFLPSVVALGALSTPEARGEAGTKDWREALAEGNAIGCVAYSTGDAVTVSEGDGAEVRLDGTIGAHGLRAVSGCRHRGDGRRHLRGGSAQ